MNELKKAYQLVTKDLTKRLLKAKEGQTVFIGVRGDFGSLKKTEHQIKSNWDQNTYAFYKVNFRMSGRLREELSRVLEKKYSRK